MEKTIHLSDVGMSREQFMRELFMPLATADVSDAIPSSMVAGAGGLSHGRRNFGAQPSRLAGLGLPHRANWNSEADHASANPWDGAPSDPINPGPGSPGVGRRICIRQKWCLCSEREGAEFIRNCTPRSRPLRKTKQQRRPRKPLLQQILKRLS